MVGLLQGQMSGAPDVCFEDSTNLSGCAPDFSTVSYAQVSREGRCVAAATLTDSVTTSNACPNHAPGETMHSWLLLTKASITFAQLLAHVQAGFRIPVTTAVCMCICSCAWLCSLCVDNNLGKL